MKSLSAIADGFAGQQGAAYFVPAPSRWPIRLSIATLFLTSGAAVWFNRGGAGPYLLVCGLLLLVLVMFGWFGNVIDEGRKGLHSAQVDQSFRWGMAWFIFSEVAFFGALFAALFYLREVSVPDLAHGLSAELWPGFAGGWPATGPGIPAGLQPMSAKGAPALNTVLLLTSGAMITWAARAVSRGNRAQLIATLALTLALGVAFLFNQASEYRHAVTDLNLTLSQGAYGATFFLLTGVHGVHVAIGAAMVAVILIRSLRGEMTAQHHFAFDAVSWYWHFVGVVWLLLYVAVYVL
jgi:cytochrome c oxidase subunit 3